MENKDMVTKVENIKWLHISDLHILLNDPSWTDYKNYLFQFLEDSHQKNPDFVVITGDYRNIMKKESFELAESFICDLMERLKLNKDKDLFMIPGNHDTLLQHKGESDAGLNPFQDRRAYELQRLLPTGLLPWERKENEEQWLSKNESDPKDYLDRLCDISRGSEENENAVMIPTLLRGFEQYQRMVKRLITWYNGSACSPADPHIRKWEMGNGFGFNIIHLNTALVADGSHCHYQALDLNKTKELFFDIKNGLPTLILAHNSFYDLHPEIQEQLKLSMSQARVCAWLCGDAHIFNTDENIRCPVGVVDTDESIRYPVSAVDTDKYYSIPIFVCGKGAPDHSDSYSENGFIFYESDGQMLTRQRFKWYPDKGIKGELPKKETLARPEIPSESPNKAQRLLIGYLSNNPGLMAENKYHLGHAYFIWCMDQWRKNDNVMILTSSYIFTHNRSLGLIQEETAYTENMIQRWEDCFDRQVKVVDIKQYLQEENPLDDNEKKLLYYITKMEMKLDNNQEWMGFIESWSRNGKIKDVAYESIMKVVEIEENSSAYTKDEVMSFAYLLYKRPTWYSSAWLVNFLHFWNVQLYPLVKDKFAFDVDASEIFIVEAKRNHYVWDAITYCAKRFSYMNFPKVEYFESLLDKDCRFPMKSSNKDTAIFLKDYKESSACNERFKTHVCAMFKTDKSIGEITEEYCIRLNIEN